MLARTLKALAFSTAIGIMALPALAHAQAPAAAHYRDKAPLGPPTDTPICRGFGPTSPSPAWSAIRSTARAW